MNDKKEIFFQLIKFGIVGLIAFVIDYGVMILLTEKVGFNYLYSSGISFSLSVIFNYIMSIKWVYNVKFQDKNKILELIVFIILSVIGLILNQLIMWLTVDLLNVFYMTAKIFATVIVMMYNFISRKIFLEK